MQTKLFDVQEADIAWCPGCGNFNILKIMKKMLSELEIKPENLVIVSGIGQAAKTPHYFRCNLFNGLHGRALPVATAIKAVNPSLTVIAESGDGCMYGEGGNHFVHAIRRNPDITVIVHNNMVYGLTKGQASPTSNLGFKTPMQMAGVFVEPFNPLAVAISLDASFVARAFAGDIDKTVQIVKRAVLHRGFSLVDIFQPCVTYNRVNTYDWFKQNTYYLEESYDPTHRETAFKRAIQNENFPLGILYMRKDKPSFENNLSVYQKSKKPLHMREVDLRKLQAVIDSKK